MSPRKIWAGYLAVLAVLVVIAIFLIARPAHADTPPTKTVAWVVTSGDFSNRWGSDQRLATEADTCGVLEQVDVYRYDTPEHIATVDALIAKGTLANGEDSTVWISNVDATLDQCVTTPPVTAPPSETSSPTPPATEQPTPLPTATQQTPTSSPSPTSPTSPAFAKPTGTATATATHRKIVIGPSLAYTGSTGTWIGAGIAGLLILAGLVLLVLHFRAASNIIDNAPKDDEEL